jgi:hypothetical protein
MYLDKDLLITTPIVAMQGRIVDIANASRQDRQYARIKPVKKALI